MSFLTGYDAGDNAGDSGFIDFMPLVALVRSVTRYHLYVVFECEVGVTELRANADNGRQATSLTE